MGSSYTQDEGDVRKKTIRNPEDGGSGATAGYVAMAEIMGFHDLIIAPWR
jgi:hypothetical protein